MPCRFPSIVACETASASNSAWPAMHSSWTDWWKTIHRLYILLRHSGSAALILDTWTYILGNGRWGNTPEAGTEWKLTDGKWESRIGRYMELAWSEQSVFLLSRHSLQTMNHRSGRLSVGWPEDAALGHAGWACWERRPEHPSPRGAGVSIQLRAASQAVV